MILFSTNFQIFLFLTFSRLRLKIQIYGKISMIRINSDMINTNSISHNNISELFNQPIIDVKEYLEKTDSL